MKLEVGVSKSEIPYPYVLEHAQHIDAEALPPAEFARWFPIPGLKTIGDEVVDAEVWTSPEGVMPLALFDGPRVDFSLQRLKHYTGTPFEHSSATSCSRTITAMSTISSNGRRTG